MKKILLALLVLGTTVGTASAQVEIGIKLSPSVAYLRADAPQQYSFKSEKSKLGIGGGLVVDYFFGQNYAFGTGLQLTSKGGTVSYQANIVTQDNEQKISLQYLEIPLTVKLFTNDITTDTKLYFQLGGKIGGLVAARIDGEKFYQSGGEKSSKHFIIPDAALLGGFGAEYQVGQSTKVFAGLSYHHGLANVDRYFEKTLNFNDVSLKNGEVALDLGIKF
ncbi:porin family protein [Hymenobacter roseosalivarius]|nr:porin family protein [Hymenobacter roseosalivarius]